MSGSAERILRSAGAISKKIRDVLHPSNGRRVVLVAFVGADALTLIGGKRAAKALDLYCWDDPNGTSPQGIRNLFRAGASIRFVSGLHMKLYWSQKAGYVLGSANLSRGALGEAQAQSLLELAVY